MQSFKLASKLHWRALEDNQPKREGFYSSCSCLHILCLLEKREKQYHRHFSLTFLSVTVQQLISAFLFRKTTLGTVSEGSSATLLLWKLNGKVPLSPHPLAVELDKWVPSFYRQCECLVHASKLQNPLGHLTHFPEQPLSNFQTMFSNNFLFSPDTQLVLWLAGRTLQSLTCPHGRTVNVALWKFNWPALCGSETWFLTEQRIKILLLPFLTLEYNDWTK